MGNLGQEAIVIGASMGGLLAARALSGHFDRVTVLDRDALPEGAQARKGVPQGRHPHGVLARGSRTLAELFPGFDDDVLAAGGKIGDIAETCLWYNFGVALKRAPSPIVGYLISRPALEACVRRRVAALPNVRIEAGTEVASLRFDAVNCRVTGVNARPAGGGATPAPRPANLVIDASGRGSRSPAWLEALGYCAPAEEKVEVGIAYMSREFRRRPQDAPGLDAMVIAACEPDWRLGVMLNREDNGWMVVLGGYFGDAAPADDAGYLAFARSLQRPDIYDVIKDAEPLSAPVRYQFPASQRRRSERLARFPDGYLVFGDSVCSFNPIYGQGMSVAAMEANALLACLDKGSAGLSRRFFKAMAKVVDVPWQLAVGADLAHPKVEGQRPAPVRFINWYVAKLYRAGEADSWLAERFLMVANLLRPPVSLFAPGVLWRVFRGTRPEAAPTLAAALGRARTA